MRPPASTRYRRKHQLRLHFSSPSPGVFELDLGEAAAQIDWQALLRELNLRGQV